MIEALGGAGAVGLNLNAPAPIPILMVGLARLRQDHHGGQARAAARAAAAQEGAAGEPGHAAPGGAVAVGSNWPSRPACRACRSSPVRRRSRSPRARWTPARREVFDVVILDTAGRLSIDQELMDEVTQIRAATEPAETLLVVDAHDRPGRGEHRARLQRGGRRDRHRDDAHGRRRARRCRAVDARDHRRADQADRRRREARRAGGLPPRARRRPHPGHGRRRRPGREGGGNASTQEEAEKLARKMAKGKFDLEDYASQLRQINKMGSLSSILGMLPGAGKIQAQLEQAGRPISTRRCSSGRRRSSAR